MSSYLRIVHDLQRRIESGALKPGARVPSTRTLARKWKVANATAAHALRELARTGHVRALARSGNVVAGEPTPASNELSRARIIRAAIRIADGEGLGALSIRGIAAKLDAPVMSLYRHVRSKDELLLAMVDAALGELRLPTTPPNGWRAQLEIGARFEWEVMRRHPWLARVVHVSRPNAMPNALAFIDWVLRALDGTALDEVGKLQIHVVLHGFVQGLAVNVEAEAEAASDSGITEAEYMRAQEHRFRTLTETGRYPYFAKMTEGLPATFDIDLDALFELGLAALLDGFAARIDGACAPASTAKIRAPRGGRGA